MRSPSATPGGSRPPGVQARTADVAWRRTPIGAAGVSLDLHPGWATLREDGLLYQRFSSEGTVSVRWGAGATIDDLLAHTGLGTGGSRVVEEEEATSVAGGPARRVRIRAIAPDAAGDAPPQDAVRIFAFTGFTLGATPVLVGYRVPASELEAFGPLLEHVVASVRRLPAPASPGEGRDL